MLNSFLVPALLLGLAIQTARMEDNSDWWSLLNENSPETNVKPTKKGLADANFQILHIGVGSQFQAIAATLGKAKSIQREDASTGREQVCYVPADSIGTTYLIFKFAEAQSAFYLFSGGSDWNGNNPCRVS